ncbi:MAG: DUF2946 domain-containing protein, partial [Ramlibacter sp.]|nr:DUF2946 domain-containing protein [Ramlibacter sp.]
MQALRRATFLARLVLAWFALAIGVAMASPLVQPRAMEVICSGAGGMKLLAGDGEAGAPVAGHALDCPLCVSLDAPRAGSQGFGQVQRAAGEAPCPVGPTRIAAPGA